MDNKKLELRNEERLGKVAGGGLHEYIGDMSSTGTNNQNGLPNHNPLPTADKPPVIPVPDPRIMPDIDAPGIPSIPEDIGKI